MAGKKRKAPVHHRRRRISGVRTTNAKHTLQMIAGLGSGAIVSQMAQNALGNNANPKLVAGGMILGGILLAKAGGHSNVFLQGLGYGMMSQGTVSVMKQFGVIKGPGDMVQYALPMAGVLEDSINGGMIEYPISGDEDGMNGYPGYDGVYGVDDDEDEREGVRGSSIYEPFENEPVGLDY